MSDQSSVLRTSLQVTAIILLLTSVALRAVDGIAQGGLSRYVGVAFFVVVAAYAALYFFRKPKTLTQHNETQPS